MPLNVHTCFGEGSFRRLRLLREVLVPIIPCISYLMLLLSLASPEPCMIMWLPSTYLSPHSMLDSGQLLTQAVSDLLFSQHEMNRYVCAPGSLLPVGYSTSTRPVSPLRAASLRLRLEPKLRCMRSICYRRQGPRSGALFLG